MRLSNERVLPAARAAVWRALSDPQLLREWWGPAGFTVPDLEFDPGLGRGYWIAMQPPEGDRFHLRGEFRAVDALERLVFTFRWDPPDPDDRETLVTLTLESRGADTVLGLDHGEFATAERLALHDAGWRDTLDRLAAFLADQEEHRAGGAFVHRPHRLSA